MIIAKEVRIIDEDKKQVGVFPISEALSLASEKNLDLVEVAPQAVPPVCRLMDYGKFLYELHKKAHTYSDAVLPFFDQIRYHSDRIEGLVSDQHWPLARYRELLFVK